MSVSFLGGRFVDGGLEAPELQPPPGASSSGLQKQAGPLVAQTATSMALGSHFLPTHRSHPNTPIMLRLHVIVTSHSHAFTAKLLKLSVCVESILTGFRRTLPSRFSHLWTTQPQFLYTYAELFRCRTNQTQGRVAWRTPTSEPHQVVSVEGLEVSCFLQNSCLSCWTSYGDVI